MGDIEISGILVTTYKSTFKAQQIYGVIRTVVNVFTSILSEISLDRKAYNLV